jgi:type VI secretion system protein ImpK
VSPPRLVDLATNWLTLVVSLRSCPDLHDPDRILQRAEELKKDFEREAQKAQFVEADIEAAVFGLAAFLDETVKRGRGRAQVAWLANPLVLQWFRIPNPGTVFFERLAEVRKDRSRRIEALEVATWCLALGFEGQLAGDRDARAKLLHELGLDITAVRPVVPPLAPHVTLHEGAGPGKVPEIPQRISVAVFICTTVLIWLLITQFSHLLALGAGDRIEASLLR